MRIMNSFSGSLAVLLSALLALTTPGCGRSDRGGSLADAPPPENPVQAAAQLEQVFTAAPPELKATVQAASTAMRSGDYEQAVAALIVVRAAGQQSMEQGIAIHNSTVALEHRLIAGIQAGDPNAKRAYDLLKRMKRD